MSLNLKVSVIKRYQLILRSLLTSKPLFQERPGWEKPLIVTGDNRANTNNLPRNVKAAYYNPYLRFSSGGQSNNYSSKGGNRVKDNEQRSLHSNRLTIVTEVTQVTSLFQPKQQSFPESSKVVAAVEGAMCIYITTFWSDITVIFIRGLLYSNFQW